MVSNEPFQSASGFRGVRTPQRTWRENVAVYSHLQYPFCSSMEMQHPRSRSNSVPSADLNRKNMEDVAASSLPRPACRRQRPYNALTFRSCRNDYFVSSNMFGACQAGCAPMGVAMGDRRCRANVRLMRHATQNEALRKPCSAQCQPFPLRGWDSLKNRLAIWIITFGNLASQAHAARDIERQQIQNSLTEETAEVTSTKQPRSA